MGFGNYDHAATEGAVSGAPSVEGRQERRGRALGTSRELAETSL